MTGQEARERPWHTVHGDEIVRMLHEVAEGADPDVVYVEFYANTETREDYS